MMPAGAEPGRWSPYAFTLAGGDPAPIVDPARPPSRTREASWPRSPCPAPRVSPRAGGATTRLNAGWTCAPAPAARPGCCYGLAARGAAHAHRRRAPPAPGRPGPRLADPPRAEQPGEPPAFEVVVADSTNPPWPGRFDRVLVDAPCSGLGALRRRPEARWRKTEADLAELTALQRALLRSALAAVRPGGVVAYVTCSPVPAETSTWSPT